MVQKAGLEIERCLESAVSNRWCSRKESVQDPVVESLGRPCRSCKGFRYLVEDMMKMDCSTDMGKW